MNRRAGVSRRNLENRTKAPNPTNAILFSGEDCMQYEQIITHIGSLLELSLLTKQVVV